MRYTLLRGRNSAGGYPAVISMGAGKSQLPVILTARKMGWCVIAVDRNSQAPGLAVADQPIVLSTHDPDPIIARLRDLARQYDIQGVINRSSGPPVVTAAYICQALGLPGVLPQAATTIVNKATLMTACGQLGIPAPRHQTVRSLSDVNWEAVRYPAVLKPALSLVGKRGIYRVEGEKDTRFRFPQAQAHSYDGLVEIQGFVPGQDVVLMSMVSRGELLPVVLLDEMNEFDSNGLLHGKGFAVPSVLSGSVQETTIHRLGRDIASKFNLDTTPFLVSFRCRIEDTPQVIEIHLDLGGDLILDKLLPASTDFDFVGFAIQVMTGRRPEAPSISFSPRQIVFEPSAHAGGPRRWRLEASCADDTSPIHKAHPCDRAPSAPESVPGKVAR